MYAHGPQCAVLGVDGCPGGWVGALVTGGRVAGWYAGDLAAMLAVPADLVAVDMPIGLPAGPQRRAADVQARALLGPARSSVFFAPPRAALEAASHPAATELSRAVGGTGVSIQTYGILRRMAELDKALDDPATAARVVETHPEVSFRAMTSDPYGTLLERKTTPAGRGQRLALLRGQWPGLDLPAPRPGRARADDCLDALACAWSGLRFLCGAASVLGDEVDAAGRPMRIVV